MTAFTIFDRVKLCHKWHKTIFCPFWLRDHLYDTKPSLAHHISQKWLKTVLCHIWLKGYMCSYRQRNAQMYQEMGDKYIPLMANSGVCQKWHTNIARHSFPTCGSPLQLRLKVLQSYSSTQYRQRIF